MYTPSILHGKPCFVQILGHSEFSAEAVSMVTVSAQVLLSAGWCLEQVLRERISWSPRSLWLLLGNGTSVYHCKSLGSNENFLKIVTVLCLTALLFSGAPHWGGNRSLTVEFLLMTHTGLGRSCLGIARAWAGEWALTSCAHEFRREQCYCFPLKT